MEKELKDLKEATQELKEKVANMPDKKPEWKEKLAESPMNDYYTENLNEESPHLDYSEFHFRQTPDDFSPIDEHGLTVKCHHSGGEPYFVIETERWAVNSPEELHALLKEIEARVSAFLWL
jgi:hypothetical protein